MNSATDILNKVLSLLADDISPVTMEAWFDEIIAVELNTDAFVICIPSDFKRQIVLSRYKENIKKALFTIFSDNIDIEIISHPEFLQRQEGGSSEKEAGYSFSNFVIGNSNKLSHAAALAVANKPSFSIKDGEPYDDYNPLFIYGGPGLGKTHLLHAIIDKVKTNYPNAKIVYTNGESFLNEFVTTVQTSSFSKFRDKYRMVDIFLLDDVQFLAGKNRPGSQEEFFYTFNTLFETKKQIVLTSDQSPKDLDFDERLKSRFERGLLTDIQPPDFETRMAIIKKKSNALGFELADDIQVYIAENIKSNVRQLEGAVKKIMAYNNLLQEPVTLETVTRAIKDIFRENPGLNPTAAYIIEQVCSFFNIPVEDLTSAKRNKELVTARHIAIYIIRSLTNLSTKEIGKEIGGRDHTTVLNSINMAEQMLKENLDIKNQINSIISSIKEG